MSAAIGNCGACPACAAADTNPYFEESYHQGGCMGCYVRWTSKQPRWVRDRVLSGITDPAMRAQFEADFIAEYRRREILKTERPLQ